MIDYSLLRRLATEPHIPAIHQAYGEEGTIALRMIMEFLTRLYERVEPDLLEGPLTVFVLLSSAGSPSSQPGVGRAFRLMPDVADAVRRGAIVELRPEEFFISGTGEADVALLSAGALVYTFGEGSESFVINGVHHRILNPNPLQSSLFSRPTFSELHEAISRYSRRIRASSCTHFRRVWGDDRRLFFRTAPEAQMRLSLFEYLSSVLRDVEVREEQNVDDSHPIDIKVTWQFLPRIALIEIKWLGKSREGDRITANHSDARARAGAKQLADYLDANRTSAPDHESLGYLVVYDGRRRNLSATTQSISRNQGYYYQDREIAFNPRYHELRADFVEPLRIFAEPICDPN